MAPFLKALPPIHKCYPQTIVPEVVEWALRSVQTRRLSWKADTDIFAARKPQSPFNPVLLAAVHYTASARQMPTVLNRLAKCVLQLQGTKSRSKRVFGKGIRGS